jgi:hypothetical protein
MRLFCWAKPTLPIIKGNPISPKPVGWVKYPGSRYCVASKEFDVSFSVSAEKKQYIELIA